MEKGGYRHAPAALPPGLTRHPLYRRLDVPQCRSGEVRKILPQLGFERSGNYSVCQTTSAVSTGFVCGMRLFTPCFVF
jgi:hypothetical protein